MKPAGHPDNDERPLFKARCEWRGADGSFAWPAGSKVIARRPLHAPTGWAQVTGPDRIESWYPEDLLEPNGVEAHLVTAYTDRALAVRQGEALRGWFQSDMWTLVENAQGQSGWVPSDFLDHTGPGWFQLAAGAAGVATALFAFAFSALVLVVGSGLIYLGLTLPNAPDTLALGLGGLSVVVSAYFLFKLTAHALRRHQPASALVIVTGTTIVLVLVALPLGYLAVVEHETGAMFGFLLYSWLGFIGLRAALQRRKMQLGKLSVPPVAIAADLAKKS